MAEFSKAEWEAQADRMARAARSKRSRASKAEGPRKARLIESAERDERFAASFQQRAEQAPEDGLRIGSIGSIEGGPAA